MTLLEVLVRIYVRHLADRRHRDVVGLAFADEVEHFPIAGELPDEQVDRVDIGAAREAVLEDLLTGPLRISHHLYEPIPLGIFEAGQHDLGVGTIVDAPGTDAAMAQAAGAQSSVSVVDQAQLHHRDQAFLLADFDRLSSHT